MKYTSSTKRTPPHNKESERVPIEKERRRRRRKEKQQVKEHAQSLTAEHMSRHPKRRSAPYFKEILQIPAEMV